MPRLNLTEYFLGIAKLVAQRSTCPRRKVGCVLVDHKNHIKATGYNGVPSGFQHCIDVPCPGAKYPGDPLKVNECWAVHAEVNAFLQSGISSENIYTAYLTVSPCRECAKIFASSSIKTIYALEKYNDPIALDILNIGNIDLKITAEM